mmetsp:Transcript_19769/g.61401  ORF Transcript_19769/g.61401 Transcript_19769/m.61401 type:complete len:113 (+) Transcript_19769:1154-1492(+)
MRSFWPPERSFTLASAAMIPRLIRGWLVAKHVELSLVESAVFRAVLFAERRCLGYVGDTRDVARFFVLRQTAAVDHRWVVILGLVVHAIVFALTKRLGGTLFACTGPTAPRA